MAKPKHEMADLATLRPTQLTLGLYQVRHKMDVSARPRGAGGLRRFLRSHRIRAIRGPGGGLYIADHHHWARAWLELGWRRAPVSVDLDLSDLDVDAFWKRMDQLGHVHAYDEHGDKLGVDALPPNVLGMRDDAYRSLAAFTRDAGAYRKPGNAYGDFSWAGFLRKYVREDMHSIAGFARALSLSIELARSNKARKLPGFIGKCGTREA
ncbi:ParB-like protein [Cupriavidus plantarum]|uniref:ParB-like protein n=1 Tax=Cupriavidus plantarum TaxID=942865 RepID=UPI001B09BA21|nr:ParB-like protein [Cupriavidus plantarum]CAG2134207.1 hypothetical protein LMG26296_01979 [Cupriavidus plantarum]SMR84363.1 hypothetical protein SAMN05421735_3150 [Cupriavidus plantarum]